MSEETRSDTARDFKAEVTAYCSHIGQDPLLVQGAGGNVSWKDGDTLWVKASGTWLANAGRQDIFVPVDLPHLRGAMAQGDFGVTPRVLGESTLRPSIETLLHALMPQRVVVHVHAIEVLAHLVRDPSKHALAELMPAGLRWVEVPYIKPGAELARAIAARLAACPDAEVVLLRNHGVVLGADSVEAIDVLLRRLRAALATPVHPVQTRKKAIPESAPEALRAQGYAPASQDEWHDLAQDPDLVQRLRTDWVLYPDHVVFLGPMAVVLEGANSSTPAWEDGKPAPFVFVAGLGTFEHSSASTAQRAQLGCYHDVLVRQQPTHRLKPLSAEDISQLLNWDAERYRQALSRTGLH